MARKRLPQPFIRQPKPEDGKLYWVLLHGATAWTAAKYSSGLWHVVGDPQPWGAVAKFKPRALEAPEE